MINRTVRKMTLKRSFALIAILIFTMCMAGCEEMPEETTTKREIFNFITDDAGRDVVFEKKPERIVVTSASFLEPLHAVGGTVVGRPDSKTQMPDWAKNLPSIGQVYAVNPEKIILCRPDLVIVNKGMNEKLLDILEENNILALVLDMKSYDSVKNEINIFGELTENTDQSKKIIDEMDSKINATIKKMPKDKHRVAILHSTAQGLSVQLEGSIAGNIVKMFGWENVAAGMTPLEGNPDAAPYSLETLAEQNPEIIFVTSMGKIEDIKANMQHNIDTNPAWKSIGAIKSGKLYYLPQDLFLLSPGLRYPEAVETMAKLVYPKLK